MQTGDDISTPVSMTVEEARSVLWLRSNPRPLGELLDEGYLDRERLQWAARWAYNPKLKAAAAVLLEHLDSAAVPPPAPPPSAPAIDAGLTIEQARATHWPFGQFKGQQMGALMDAQRLSLKDLVYAIDHAWDDRVRRAAIVLAALKLEQTVEEPPPPAGPLKVLSGGRSFSVRRQFQLTMLQGFLGGVLVGAWILWLVQNLLRPRTVSPTEALSRVLALPGGVIVLTVVIVFLIGVGLLGTFFVNFLVKGIDRAIDNYRKGEEGEEAVVEVLRQNLDGNWTLFRNITLPGRNRADIDAVLVGPPGVWVLEIKNMSGEYRNIGEHWEVRAGRRWKLVHKSPGRQAQGNAVRLSNFLRVDGIRQWVTPAVVWANAQSPVTVENPAVAVWTLDQLPEELDNLWEGRTIDEEKRRRIVEKLTGLFQKSAG